MNSRSLEVDARQSADAGRPERVVAAGIEDQNIEHVVRPRYGIDDEARIDRALLQASFVAHGRIDRNKIILARDLRPVARVVEKAHAFAVRQRIAEAADRFQHLGLARIENQLDGEACAAKRVRNVRGVIPRIGERCEGV